jgi:aminopeptidase N
MMELFSRLTGVDYPWAKYAQVTGRDYIFGAMENTSATLHEESAQQDDRELTDGNSWELVIAHELFHQWFGDYVTTESWSNTTLNESFADYSETLWNEYAYGRDAGQQQIYQDRLSYLNNTPLAGKKLVTFDYNNAFDMFDQISYQKGGCILHMLRNYVGDSAFFKSIKLYLDTYKYKSAEAHQLRIAFEEVTGKDLNWFWNQWYYGSGHPKLHISYTHDQLAGTVTIHIAQKQEGKAFQLPMAVDIYNGEVKKRYLVTATQAVDSFTFHVTSKPDLVNVDADKILVAEKTDLKTGDEFRFQYLHGNYIDRYEAIQYFLAARGEIGRTSFLSAALKDPNKDLRRYVLSNLNIRNDTLQRTLAAQLERMARTDKERLVRADAIECLGFYPGDLYKKLFQDLLGDSSYTIAGRALEALAKIDSNTALSEARHLSLKPAKKRLRQAIIDVFVRYGGATDFPYVYRSFSMAGLNGKFELLSALMTALSHEPNKETVLSKAKLVAQFRDEMPEFVRVLTSGMINGALAGLADARKEDATISAAIGALVK